MNPAADPVRAAQTLRCPTTAARRHRHSRAVSLPTSYSRDSWHRVRRGGHLRRIDYRLPQPRGCAQPLPSRSGRQAYTSPALVTATECLAPPATCVTSLPSKDDTDLGVGYASAASEELGTSATSLPRQSRAARRRIVPTRKAPRAARADVSPPVAPPRASSPPPRLSRDPARALCDAPGSRLVQDARRTGYGGTENEGS